jgi:hypothetical protein
METPHSIQKKKFSRKEFWKHSLKPLSSKKKYFYDFVGFDIETIGESNNFYMGGITFYKWVKNKTIYINSTPENEIRQYTGIKKEEYYKILCYRKYYEKQKMVNELLGNEFKGKYFVATNLSFDFNALYFDNEKWKDFKILFRGSDIIHSVYSSYNSNKKGKTKFIDTMNYIPFGVEKLGKILNIKKLEAPSFLGKRKPLTEEEKLHLENYNMRDCLISMEYMYFMQDGINKGGGKLKISIASSSLDIWRRGFQNTLLIKEQYILKQEGFSEEQCKHYKKLIFQSYYGGRTECYVKGHIKKKLYYYDINSLYPSVMRNKFPLPNSIKIIDKPELNNIINWEGISKCLIKTPEKMDKPFLPYRKKGKLIFPLGVFIGSYTHIELRNAIKLGYIVKPLEQIIYTETFNPFEDFINYFYKKRMEEKKKCSPFELVYKLIMNSLYGKFAELNNDIYIVINKEFVKDIRKDVLNKMPPVFEENEKFYIGIIKKEYDGNHSFPVLSSYVTSYARILMYNYINHEEVVYTDTDSCITTKKLFSHSEKLGEMKLENTCKSGFIVKPKFYYLEMEGKENDFKIKIKGLRKATYNDFNMILGGSSIYKLKFFKLKESIRQNKKVNSVQEVKKSFTLFDDKRIWENPNEEGLEYSEPLIINENG